MRTSESRRHLQVDFQTTDAIYSYLVVGYADGCLPRDRRYRLQLVEHRVGELAPRPHSRRWNRRRLVPGGRRERRQLAIGAVEAVEAVEPIDLVVGVPAAAASGTAGGRRGCSRPHCQSLDVAVEDVRVAARTLWEDSLFACWDRL